MNRILALSSAAATLLALAACEPTTPSNATSEGGIPFSDFVLVGIGQDAVPTRNMLLTLGPGGFTGSGPCNTYQGTLFNKLPDFHVKEMTWTDNACPKNLETALEQRYFQAMSKATQVEWKGDVLRVIGDTYMTFEPGRPASTPGDYAKAQSGN